MNNFLDAIYEYGLCNTNVPEFYELRNGTGSQQSECNTTYLERQLFKLLTKHIAISGGVSSHLRRLTDENLYMKKHWE